MKLTPTQQTLLLHRFACPDVLVDEVHDVYFLLPSSSPKQEEIEDAVKNVKRLIELGHIDLGSTTGVENAVLQVAMTKCFYLTERVIALELNPASYARKAIQLELDMANWAADMLERKWTDAFNVPISIPRS